jgi:hypothetical protein
VVGVADGEVGHVGFVIVSFSAISNQEFGSQKVDSLGRKNKLLRAKSQSGINP